MAAAHAPVTNDDDDAPTPPDVVDFDALHAALGELPPPPTSSSPSIGESQGRSSATYSSARPHTIPPTRAPVAAELNAPPVIVQTDDTVPTGPPQQMTVPMAGAPPYGGAAAPMQPGMAQSPPAPFAPEPFAAGAVQQAPPGLDPRTIPLPPRRPRTPTIVVRTRGPTKQQKLLVFMAMLLVFVGGGIAFLVYGKQLGLDLDLDLQRPAPRPTATAPAVPTTTATSTTTSTMTTTPATPSIGTVFGASPATASAAAPSALPPASTVPPMKKPPRKAAPSPSPSPPPPPPQAF